MRAALTLAAALALEVAGCGGAPVRVRAYDPNGGTDQAGAVYFLPKARLEIGFDVTLDGEIDAARCEQAVAECKYRFDAPEINQVRITTQQLPDPKAGFVIETSGTFVTTTDFTGTFSPTGELTSASANSEDHTIEFAAEGVEAIAKIASVVAMAGPTQAATTQAQFKRRRALLTLLAKSDAALAEARPCIGGPYSGLTDERPASHAKAKDTDVKPVPTPKPQAASPAPPAPTPATGPCVSTYALQRTVELRAALLRELRALDEQLSVSKVIHIRCAFDPPKRAGSVEIRKDGGVCPAYSSLKFQLAQAGFDVPLPTLTVQWSPAGGGDRSSDAARGSQVAPGATTFAGIVYRIPEWFSVTVSRSLRADGGGAGEPVSTTSDIVATGSDAVAIAGDVVALPQFGRLFATSFDKADLGGGRELKIELHEGQGSLKTLSFKNTAAKPEQVQRVVDGALSVARTAQRPEVDEVTRLQKETERAEAERKYIEAMKALEDAKRTPAPEPTFTSPERVPSAPTIEAPTPAAPTTRRR